MPVTNYIYDPVTEAYLMEQDGDGNTTVVYTQEPVKYGDVIAQHRIDPATGVGQSYYYHPDALGSTRELTDANGDVVTTYNYDAFGNTIASTGTVENPFRFTGNVGYYWDEELQTYHIRARNYRPTIGRWMSQDPLGFVDGSNLFLVYFIPSRSDPSGTQAKDDPFIPDDPFEPIAPPETPPASSLRFSKGGFGHTETLPTPSGPNCSLVVVIFEKIKWGKAKHMKFCKGNETPLVDLNVVMIADTMETTSSVRCKNGICVPGERTETFRKNLKSTFYLPTNSLPCLIGIPYTADSSTVKWTGTCKAEKKECESP